MTTSLEEFEDIVRTTANTFKNSRLGMAEAVRAQSEFEEKYFNDSDTNVLAQSPPARSRLEETRHSRRESESTKRAMAKRQAERLEDHMLMMKHVRMSQRTDGADQ